MKFIAKYRPVFFIIRPFLRIYITIVILSIVTAFLSSFNVVALFPVLDALISGTEATTNPLLSKIRLVTQYMPLADPVSAACVFLLSVTLINLISVFFLEFLIGKASSMVGYVLKDRLFRKYSAMDVQFFIENKHGKLFYDLFIAPQRASTLITHFSEIIAVIFTMLCTVALLFYLNVIFTIFILGFVVIFALLVGVASKHVSYAIGKKKKMLGTQQQNTANELINGIKQIRVYLAQRKWMDDFDWANKQLRSLNVREVVWISVPKHILEFFLFLFIVVIAVLARNKTMSVANLKDLAIYLVAVMRLLPSITSFGRLRMTIMTYLPDAEIAYSLFSQEYQTTVELGSREFVSVRDSIVFEHVGFRYKDRALLFEDLNLKFRANQTTALVGSSGSGKTTIVNLFLTLLRPQHGAILVDGIDVNEFTMKSWLAKIAFVSQDLFTFNATIKENIKFGNDTYTDDEIIRAAKVAHAHEFICELPQQYETICGEKGMKLSIGQQQRISIARAIIRNPSILVFDEATSSLDTVSENLIQQALGDISKNRTVVVIAHRLSTIKNADKIIVLKEGKKIEEGTHAELVARKGCYWDLYSKAIE